MGFSITTDSPCDTERLGESVGRRCRGGEIIALTGDLGAGKTCFVKGIGRGLDIARMITSPTFVIAQSYTGGRLPLVHIDLYRVGGFSEIEDLGWEDMKAQRGVIVLEWAEKMATRLREEKAVFIAITYTGETSRAFSIDCPSAAAYLFDRAN